MIHIYLSMNYLALLISTMRLLINFGDDKEGSSNFYQKKQKARSFLESKFSVA